MTNPYQKILEKKRQNGFWMKKGGINGTMKEE